MTLTQVYSAFLNFLQAKSIHWKLLNSGLTWTLKPPSAKSPAAIVDSDVMKIGASSSMRSVSVPKASEPSSFDAIMYICVSSSRRPTAQNCVVPSILKNSISIAEIGQYRLTLANWLSFAFIDIYFWEKFRWPDKSTMNMSKCDVQ